MQDGLPEFKYKIIARLVGLFPHLSAWRFFMLTGKDKNTEPVKNQ
jgi:hypothetical protein